MQTNYGYTWLVFINGNGNLHQRFRVTVGRGVVAAIPRPRTSLYNRYNSPFCTFFNVHLAVYTTHYTVYNTHYTVYTTHYTVYTTHYTVSLTLHVDGDLSGHALPEAVSGEAGVGAGVVAGDGGHGVLPGGGHLGVLVHPGGGEAWGRDGV